MKKLFSILDIIVGTINQTIAVYGMILGVLLAFINVVLRYIFDMSLPWAAELIIFLFGQLFLVLLMDLNKVLTSLLHC